MEFGLTLPHRGPLAAPATMEEIAKKAEALGYGYIAIPDHIVVPRKILPNYPYSETGEFLWSADGVTDSMEQFTLLAWIAAVTHRIRVMTSIAVVPHRSPLFMAKSLATTDVLSGGRVTVGCGAGWMVEEFEALNLPPFEARGQVTNEYIAAMKVAWTNPNPFYEGKFVKFSNVDTDPRPIQKPHPPIWIGGESTAALKRVIALGDAWYPFGSNPKFRMDKLETFTARLAVLHQLSEKTGRDPSTINLSYNCAFHSARPSEHIEGGRQTFTGSPEQRAEDFRDFADAGVQTMIVNVSANKKDVMLARMAEFAENVMPLVS